jgi:hypothetical protein
MKLSQQFNTRITPLVDTYRGSVPLARCILEATHIQQELPSLQLMRDSGDIFLEITFADGSHFTLGINEEF